MKPQLRYLVEHLTNPIWGNDEFTKNKYGYEIKDLSVLGISSDTTEKCKLIGELYFDSLNEIYQILPSFWSGKMHKYFQSLVKDTLKNIQNEIGDKFEIIVADSTKLLIEEQIDENKIDLYLFNYIENPIKYYNENGITNTGDEILEFNLTQSAYMKWKTKENIVLKK